MNCKRQRDSETRVRALIAYRKDPDNNLSKACDVDVQLAPFICPLKSLIGSDLVLRLHHTAEKTPNLIIIYCA